MRKTITDTLMDLAGPACVLLFLGMIAVAVRAAFWIFPVN